MGPVHLAALWNRVELLWELLDDDPDAIHDWWQDVDDGLAPGQPLHFACKLRATGAAEFLLNRGASVGRDPRDQGWDPLRVACYLGDPELVSLLLAHGADPCADPRTGATALHNATGSILESEYGDHPGVIRALLKDGRVAVNARNRSGKTALWLACRKGHLGSARILLEEGCADYTIPGGDGARPKDHATRHPDLIPLFQVR